MRATLLATTAILSIAFSATAFGQTQQSQQQGQAANPQPAQRCLSDLQAYDRQLMSGNQNVSYSAQVRDEVRQLREAARILAMNGNEQGCQTVLSEMRRTVEAHQAKGGTAAPARGNENLQSAQSVEQHQGLMRAEDIIGTDIRNTQNQDLGTIEDVVLNPQTGKVDFVLVGHGGIFGIGQELTPVRWSDLKVTPDGETYVLDVPADTLDSAPKINADTWKQRSSNWAQDVQNWWNQHIRG